jgi:flavin-dependent dehydrogenase
MATAQVLVIGGGIAGSAAAAHIAEAGREVVLVERRVGPHDKVCGEFVSGEACFYLEQLDIHPRSFGAVRISALEVHSSRSTVNADLPFPALSVSRRLLDEAIINVAVNHGVDVQRGRVVRALHQQSGRWTAELDDGSRISTADVFLATGKHDLRGWKRPPGQQNDLIAFKLHWRVTSTQAAALSSLVELFLFPGGYAGLSLVEDGIANLCLLVRRRSFAALGDTWDSLLSTLCAEFTPLRFALAGGEPCMKRPLAVASIPYGFVRRAGNGLWCLGDQAAVIPSFSGDGISIALHSARLAAVHYLAGRPSAQFQAALARDVTRQVRTATMLSRLLVQPFGRLMIVTAAQLVPGLVPNIARATRIPEHRLIRTDLPAEQRLTALHTSTRPD